MDDLRGLKNLLPNHPINRFEISCSENQLIIKEGRTINSRAAFRAIFAVAASLIFFFLSYIALSIDAAVFIIVILSAVSLFSLGYAIHRIMNGYFSGRKLLFNDYQLIIRKTSGVVRKISKKDVGNIYVRDLIIRGDRLMEIRLGKKAGASLHDDNTIMTLDFPNTSWFSVKKNLKNFENTKAEAFQIGKIIAEYWKIPFSVFPKSQDA